MQLFHGLLRQGWCFLYSRANSSEFDDFSADSDSFLPLASSSLEPLAVQDGSDGSCPKTVDQHFETANESREVLKRKEFVRARKAREWIMDENMAINLVQVLVGTGPNESYLHLMLREHSQDTWTGQHGLQQVPLVRLAQPGKSPVSQNLDSYCRMQTTPVRVLLEVVEALPCFSLAKEQISMFEMLVDMASSIWRKQHLKHESYPWKLAPILDRDYPQELKRKVLTHFFGLSRCCLEDGYAGPLQEKFASAGIDECLRQGSSFMMCLVNTFCSKTQNVELENNFARASSARAYVRGNRHSSATMCCKHVASDIHESHQNALGMSKPKWSTRKRKHGDDAQGCLTKLSPHDGSQEAGGFFSLPTSVSTLARNTDGATSSSKCSLQNSRQPTRLNSWHLCLQDVFSEPENPFETSNDRFQRLTEVARHRMLDERYRAMYAARAKATNEANKVASPDQAGLLALLNKDKPLKLGPWGLGDKSYPLTLELLQKYSCEKGFVKKYDSKFVKSYGGLVEHAEGLPGNDVVLEKFCMKLGGCFHALGEQEKNNILAVLRQMRNVVRMHRKRRGCDHHPSFVLLLAQVKDGSTVCPDGFPKAYLLCQASLNPLDLCLWECTITEAGNSGDCSRVMCPRAFSVTLDHTVHPDLSGSMASMTVPTLQTMHQFAYSFRHRGFEGLRLRVTSTYEVTALNALYIGDAEATFGMGADDNALPVNPDECSDDSSGDDGGDDPTHENISKCMALLRGQSAGPKKPRTNRQRTDEPRHRETPRSSKQAPKRNQIKRETSAAVPCDLPSHLLIHSLS